MTGFMKTRLVKFSPLLAQIHVNAFFGIGGKEWGTNIPHFFPQGYLNTFKMQKR